MWGTVDKTDEISYTDSLLLVLICKKFNLYHLFVSQCQYRFYNYKLLARAIQFATSALTWKSEIGQEEEEKENEDKKKMEKELEDEEEEGKAKEEEKKEKEEEKVRKEEGRVFFTQTFPVLSHSFHSLSSWAGLRLTWLV